MRRTLILPAVLAAFLPLFGEARADRGLCDIVSLAGLTSADDLSEGLDWPDRASAATGACDIAAVHERLTATRTTETAIALKDLHQATYRDPAASITRLLLEGFVGPKRDDVAPEPMTLPVDWGRDDHDRNWRFNLNAWKMLEPIFAYHEKTGEVLAMDFALALVADWSRFNIDEGQENGFAWYDIASGQRAMKLAYMIDRAYRGTYPASDEAKRMLLRLGHIHVEKLLDPDFINPGNHGTFQIHGLAALCRAVPVYALCQDAGDYIAAQIDMLVRGQFGAESVHMEHSAEYHFFMFKVFERLFSTGWYDDLASTKGLLEEVDANKKWLIYPTGEVVRHGDSDERREPLPSDLAASAPVECAATSAFDANCVILKAFPETGYATVRSQWNVPADVASMLFLMGSYHSHAHKQSDHLSLELFERGMPVIVDSGKFAYDESNPRRQYVKSTRAHNTVEIDGGDYSRTRRDAVGSMLEAAEETDWGYRLTAGMTHGETATRHNRALYYRPGRWLAVVDHLVSDQPRKFEQWFHFHEDLEAELDGNGYELALPDGSRVQATTAADVPGCALRRVRGQSEPRLQGWISREYRSFLENDAVGHACEGEAVTIVTLFVIGEEGDEAEVSLVPGTGGWTLRDSRDGFELAVVPTDDKPDLGTADAGPAVQETKIVPEEAGDDDIVGYALLGADGVYRAALGNVILKIAGRGWKTLDEAEVEFLYPGQSAPAFAIRCAKGPGQPCRHKVPAGTIVGDGAFSGHIGRYYDEGAFAGGAFHVVEAEGERHLTGQLQLTEGGIDQIGKGKADIAFTLEPLDEAPVRDRLASWRCDGADPRPLLDELARGRYRTRTFRQLASAGADPERVTVLIRHDMDHSPLAAADLGVLEAERGLAATHFVHLGSGYAGAMSRDGDYAANPWLVPALLGLQAEGHEIGYHTDALFMDLFHGLAMEEWLPAALDGLRQAGLVIESEAANGSPYARATGAHNRYSYADFRTGGRLAHLVTERQRQDAGFLGSVEKEPGREASRRSLPEVTMADLGLRHAAYYPETYGVDPRAFIYLSDSKATGQEMIETLRTAEPGSVVQILLHPARWSSCRPGTLTTLS